MTALPAGAPHEHGVRTLFVTADSPYPATSGAPLRNWQNITLAAALGPVAVLSIGHAPSESAVMPHVERWDHVVVPRTPDFVPRGYPMLGGAALDTILPRIDAMLAAFLPAIVVFENLWLGRLPSALRANGARVVFDSHNVYVSVAEQLGMDAGPVAALECAAAEAADEMWVCSVDDGHRMQAEYALGYPIRVVPNGIDVDYYASIRSGRLRRARRTAPTLLFVGAYWYEPNRLAAESLIGEVLPHVRERLGPDVRLVLVGAAPSPAMLAASSRDPGIVVAGRVPDVRPYLALADAVVVPLRHGGGTRLKILEAFAAERPVVSTARGIEGLDARDGEHLLVRESAGAIADAACDLWTDRERASAMAARAYAMVDATYSWQALRAVVAGALEAASRHGATAAS